MKTLLLFISLVFAVSVSAQTATWDRVYNILNTNCSTSGCHDGTSSIIWDLSGGSAATYNQLIGVTPNNIAAASIGDKLVDPGYPYRSFLLRKIAHGLGSFASTDLALNTGEGSPMPFNQPALSPTEVELIRQWILAGASATEDYATADSALLAGYYSGSSLPMLQQPAAPPAGQGIQIHYGPVFYQPGEEAEYFLKYDPRFTQDLAIDRIDVTMNDEAVHFTQRVFKPGIASQWDEGLEPLNPLTAFDADKDFVWRWRNDGSMDPIDGVALFYNDSSVFDFNMQAVNYNTQILPVEAYINIYFDQAGIGGNEELKSVLVNNANLFIPPNATQTFSATYNLQQKYIWAATSFTFSRGADFKMHLRNAAGQDSSLLYDGMFDYINGFNLGFYDWEHPPIRFEQDSGIYCANGIRYEATYNNTSNNLITFGFTTNDEQMLALLLYTDNQVNNVVTPPLEVTAVTNNNSICIGDTAQLNAVASGGTGNYTYSWTPGTGLSCTNCSNPQANPTANVTYQVSVTDGFNTVTDTVNILVSASFSPSVTINYTQANLCEGQSFSFTANTTNGGINPSYQWLLNGNLASLSNTLSTGNLIAGDVVSLSMTSSYSCASPQTVNSTVTIVSCGGALTANATASNTTVCVGESTTLSAGANGGSGNYTYTWSPNTNLSCTNCADPVASPGSNTTYTVVVNDGSSTVSDTVSVSVTPAVTPAVVIGYNQNNLCSGQSFLFDATPSNGGSNPTYQWALNGSVISSGATYFNSTLVVGDVVSVSMTSTANCASPQQVSDTVVIIDCSIPLNITTTSDRDTICPGEPTELVVTATGGTNVYSYTWSPSADLSTSTGDTVTASPTNTTTYLVTVDDGNTTAVDSITVVTSATLQANIAIAADADTLCPGNNAFMATATNAGSNPTYQWTLNGNFVGTNTSSITLQGLSEGDEVRCNLTSSDPCVSAPTVQSNVLEVLSCPDTSTGVSTIDKIRAKVIPNPASSMVTIVTNMAGTGSFTLYDLAGRSILATELEQGTVDVSQLQQGMYLYRIAITGQADQFGKLLIER